MPKMVLTDLTIRSLKSDTRIDFWDVKLPSFGIRVGPRSKTFIARVGSGRHALGSYPEMSLQDARRSLLALKASQPSVYKKTTFSEAYDAFKSIHCSQKKARTQKDYLRMLDVHYMPILRTKPLDTITHRQIADITDALIDRPSECRHAMGVGRTFFKFCVRRRYIPSNPMEGVQLPKHTPRDRVLTDAEIKVIWNATADGKIFSDIVRLLILTGQRRGEIGQLQTSWIGEEEIVFPREVVKNNREHRFPIGAFCSAQLAEMRKRHQHASGYIFFAKTSIGGPFNGWMKCKLTLDKKLAPDFAPWTLHDCRRTFATNMAKLGVRLEVTEKLLNHVSGSTGGIVGVYMKYNFESEMRAAVALWEQKLASIVA